MTSEQETDGVGQDGPPHPAARRAYRVLGLLHAPLFAAMIALPAFQEGHLWWAVGGGVVVAVLTLGLFWRLAEDHYCGNVPRKPGALVYKGDDVIEQPDGDEQTSAAEQLAEATGEPVEKFQPPEDIEYPDLDDLEKLPEAEWVGPGPEEGLEMRRSPDEVFDIDD